jgi:hypothetical protein
MSFERRQMCPKARPRRRLVGIRLTARRERCTERAGIDSNARHRGRQGISLSSGALTAGQSNNRSTAAKPPADCTAAAQSDAPPAKTDRPGAGRPSSSAIRIRLMA